MNNTQHSIMVSFFKIFQKGGKHYICPSVNSMLKVLSAFHYIDIKRRRYFQAMEDLRNAGYVKTYYRFTNDENGEIRQIPSIITMTIKGCKYLILKGVKGASKILSRILSWLKKDDRRFPEEKDVYPGYPEEKRIENLARLKALLEFL